MSKGLLHICSIWLLFLLSIIGLSAQRVVVGAERMELLLPLLEGKRIALMGNQSSVIGEGMKTHLLDSLLSRGVNIEKIFVPEHGFRGTVDAGKAVRNGRDSQTNIPIISLYGKLKRPTAQMLSDVDVIVFDLQDVGTRFYTYISSMHYLMEVCAEQGKTFVVCDRPNPNDYIDGPVLELDCRSFVGVDPIPLLHGMTVGELARMINGERWLRGGAVCQLEVIPLKGWKHGDSYSLPVRPSPNLPDSLSVALYPSLCLFEATDMSVGRGTPRPFTVLGYPDPAYGDYQFTPRVTPGADLRPKHQDKRCYGVDLSKTSFPERRLSLDLLIRYYRLAKERGEQLINQRQLFYLLAGTKMLQRQIEEGQSEDVIRDSWQKRLEEFKRKRKKYLLYRE